MTDMRSMDENLNSQQHVMVPAHDHVPGHVLDQGGDQNPDLDRVVVGHAQNQGPVRGLGIEDGLARDEVDQDHGQNLDRQSKSFYLN